LCEKHISDFCKVKILVSVSTNFSASLYLSWVWSLFDEFNTPLIWVKTLLQKQDPFTLSGSQYQVSRPNSSKCGVQTKKLNYIPFIQSQMGTSWKRPSSFNVSFFHKWMQELIHYKSTKRKGVKRISLTCRYSILRNNQIPLWK